MSRKEKLESVPKFPGIARILVRDVNSGNWKVPSRGARFRVSAYSAVNAKTRIRERFETFSEAKEFWMSLNSGVMTIQSRSDVTFADVVDKWKRESLVNRDPATQISYLKHLKHFEFFNIMSLRQIDSKMIDRWLSHIKSAEYLAKGRKSRCNYRHEYSTLRLIFTYYAEEFDRNYVIPLTKQHRKMISVKPKFITSKDLSVAQLKQFMEALKFVSEKNGNYEIYYLALFQYFTYSRIQEAAALSFEDFDFHKKKIILRNKVQWYRDRRFPNRIVPGSKANAGKEIELCSVVEKAFSEFVLRSGIRSSFLFCPGEQIIDYSVILRRYNEALKHAGLPFTATHLLRHASLSEFYDTCRDLKQTARVAGHSSTKMTERYAKVRDERLAETHSKMDAKLAGIL